MKKFFSFLLALTLILSSYTITNAKTFTNDKEKVLSVITGYLEHSLNLQKDLKVTNNTYIHPNSKLSKFYKLSSDSIVKWYSSTFGQWDWFNLDVKINSIEHTSEFVIVDVDEIVSGEYIGADELTKYEVNHILYLKYHDNELLIERDITSFEKNNNKTKTILSDEDYNTYIDEKIKIEEEKATNLNSKIEEINNSINSSENIETSSSYTTRSAGYNRWAASRYAIDHAYAKEDYYEEDCTNFVSKALAAGGLPTDDIWFQGSNPWIRVIELRDYLISAKRAKEYYMYLDSSQLGDVIQLYNSEKGTWAHSVIITGVLGNARLVSAHSFAEQNVSFTKYYPGKSFYSNYRVLHIIY